MKLDWINLRPRRNFHHHFFRNTHLLDRLRELHEFYRTRLLDDCLPFWIEHAVDQEHGGFITSLNRDGTIVDTDKGVWQQGRFTWLLGELFNDPSYESRAERPHWLELARHGGDFLQSHGFDPEDGRMWFLLDREGNPIRKRRYAFTESFAAIAFGELARATGEDSYRQRAEKCFARFLSHSRDPQAAPPKFTAHRPMQSIGFPMITIGTAQELRGSIGLPNADAIIDEAIDTIETCFVHSDLEYVLEVVGPEGEFIDHFDGRTVNPGHAIEAAWFIMNEGRIRNVPAWVDLGRRMLDWMFRWGWDTEYGGLLYFVDVRGLPVQEYWHDMKFWWPHNEAMIAALLALELTGDPRYLEMHDQIHRWAFDHFADPVHGEWFGYLHRDGRLSVPLKGNHWKGPFHYPRMLLQCLRTIERMGN